MTTRGSLSLMGSGLLLHLREEARHERELLDDDLPRTPEADDLASAQSRRAAKDSTK
jgi:hypothetical protein